jgi:membrane fusion protein (multidrug efflux system)
MSIVAKVPAAETAERISAERVTGERPAGEPQPLQKSPPAQAAETPPSPSVVRQPPARRKGRLRALLMLGGIAGVVVASGYVWVHGGRWIAVDDAYVRAAKLMVSTDISGLVASVDVHEGQTVKAGDVLFRVDPLQFQIAVENAKAQLAQTALTLQSMQSDYQRMLADIETQQSQVALAQATFDRQSALLKSDNVSKANYDQARFGLDTAKNTLASLREQAAVQLVKIGGKPNLPITELPQYKQAKSQLDEAQRQLDHTTVRAPFDGIATQVDTLQPGTFLVSQTAALTNTGAIGLVSTSNVWIEANTKETDLTYAKVGDPVDVYVDSYPGRVWHGRVQSISPASGAEFSILPAQNSSGNWVKVVQRVPVRISIDQDKDSPVLRSGMTVTADIDTGHVRSFSELWAPNKDVGRGGSTGN